MIVLHNEQASESFALALAQVVTAPMILTFSGEIGVGKTTIIRAFLKSLGVTSAIKSPTFSLIETYEQPQAVIHHFDLYRICDEIELEYIGFRDYFTTNSICLIEWPERAPCFLECVDVALELTRQGYGRHLSMRSLSTIGQQLLEHLGEGPW